MNRNWMQGRYGFDQLSLFIMIIAMIFWPVRHGWVIILPLFALAAFRIFSRNIAKRQREQQVFQGVLWRVSAFIRKYFAFVPRFFRRCAGLAAFQRTKWKGRHDYQYLHCPRCHKILRLPRGKGKLQVRCPVCGHQFIKKT